MDLMKPPFKSLMRAATGLVLVLLLVSCVSMETIPDTWPKRYREFLQKVEMPIARRVSLYLGLETGNSPVSQANGKPIVFYTTVPSAVRMATIRFNAAIDGVATASIETSFNPSVTCISLEQLKEVGDFQPGNDLPVHVTTGPGGTGYVRFVPQPDHFIFRLADEVRVDALIVMERGCLTGLHHALPPKPTP